MTELRFFTDPHLGLWRTSHTTQASRMRLRAAMLEAARRAVSIPTSLPAEATFCLGDLFDQATNSEDVIAQGLWLSNRAHVMGGNHDVLNREGRMPSLQFLESAWETWSEGSRIYLCGAGSGPTWATVATESDTVYLVPHHMTQALFEQALKGVEQAARRMQDTRKLLCLHCNYDSTLVKEGDAALNLPQQRALELLETFDWVLLGHEHQPRQPLPRLLILGNTHPTSFSDISDKFTWDYKDGEFTSHLIWREAEGFRRMTWEELLEGPTLTTLVQFVEVVGKAEASRMPAIAAAIANLWKAHPDLLMVRNQVQPDDGGEEDSPLPDTVHKAMDLPARVTHALSDSDLLPLWNEYLETLSC